MKKPPMFKAAAVTVAIAAVTPASAETIEVQKCNVLSGGSYRPALTVHAGGEKHVFEVGDGVLTRKTIFNEKAALAFVAQRLGLDLKSLSYSDCASPAQGGSPAPTVVTPPPPPPPPPVDEGGCSCGACYQ